MSVNRVTLLGRLGKDPETRFMTNGEGVTNFSLATSEKWKNQSGEKQEKTEWHNCVAYRKLAEIIGEYVRKGEQLYVEGKLQTRKWQDKEGKDRYTTEIIIDKVDFIGNQRQSDGDTSTASRETSTAQSNTSTATRPPGAGDFSDIDDGITFMEPCRHYGMWRVI